MNKFVYILILILVISTFVKAQKTIPCDIEIDKKAQKLYDKARKANSKGDKAKETEYYLAAIEIQDDWVAPYYQLGMQIAYKIEIQTQDFEKLYPRALEYLEKAVSLCPDYNPAAYFYLGKIYYNIAVYEKAVIHLECFCKISIELPHRYGKSGRTAHFSELYDKMLIIRFH
jgi:tetratricopeptide (TPR) repeat protein